MTIPGLSQVKIRSTKFEKKSINLNVKFEITHTYSPVHGADVKCLGDVGILLLRACPLLFDCHKLSSNIALFAGKIDSLPSCRSGQRNGSLNKNITKEICVVIITHR